MNPPLMHGSDWQGESLAGWIVTEKFDGFRAVWTGQRLVTREGVDYNAPAWFTAGLPGIPLDAELFAGYGRRDTLNGAHAWRDESRWRGLKLMVFDAPGIAGNYATRHNALSQVKASPYCGVVRWWSCKNRRSLHADFESVVARGGEGLMLHHPTAHYTPGRVRTLLKIKRREQFL